MLTAVAASLCCITPVLALFAGASGMASTFSFLEPARPYMIGLTVAVLGFAWYQKLKSGRVDVDCDCDDEVKPSFMQSPKFLGIITVFAGLMLSFPSYAHIFYPDNDKGEIVIVYASDVETTMFVIDGMTCTSCEEHVKYAVNKLPGVIEATASWEDGTATVRYDKSKSSKADVLAAIDDTGYKVTEERHFGN